MIDPSWVQMMSRYNQWQNQNLYSAADTLSDDDRRTDRGAFFKSIHGTLSHILWADRVWLARFRGQPVNFGTIAQSPEMIGDWGTLKAERTKMDQDIQEWASLIESADLCGELVFYSVSMDKEVRSERGLCVVHMFNHQTHHRGQAHALLTASGVTPSATDLPLMPAD